MSGPAGGRAGGDPVVPGWAYQWLVRRSPTRDRWTAPVDVRHVRPEAKPAAVAVAQRRASGRASAPSRTPPPESWAHSSRGGDNCSRC